MLNGRTAIGEYLKDAAAHGVGEGARVLCSMLELDGGRIARQTDVQAWDE